nr:hypothetical protein [Planctomycetota bacterium]
SLARRPRTWGRTIGLCALVGSLASACCRAGLAIPDERDALAVARALAELAQRHAGLIRVRERLAGDYPQVDDHAYTAASGALAERVVLGSRPRVQAAIARTGEVVGVAELLGDPERFVYRCDDARAAARAILDGSVTWDAHGRMDLHAPGGRSHRVGGVLLGLGIGGLHSEDPAGVVEGPLVDLDVASYYPAIIVAERIRPPQLPEFSERVGALMERRLAAKRAGDRLASDALKIVVNSLYGQLGNQRSGLWSPPDALRVVLTGQLRLLELIDGVIAGGGELVSANTDGIVARGVGGMAGEAWQRRSGFVLEERTYARLIRTSINDYVAVGADGAVAKTKGAFGGGDDDVRVSSRSAAPIIARAAVGFLVHGQAIADVVAASRDILDFCFWRRARDLSIDERPIDAAVVRWAVGRGGRAIVQRVNGTMRTVAESAVLVEQPAGLEAAIVDRSWYVRAAQQLVDGVFGPRPGDAQQSIFD